MYQAQDLLEELYGLLDMNKKENSTILHINHRRLVSILLMIYDSVAVTVSYFAALWIRFDFIYSQIPTEYLRSYRSFIPFYIVFCLILFWFFRLYRSLWAYASFVELNRTLAASLLASLVHIIAISLIYERMPLSYHFVGTILQFGFLAVARFSYRILQFERNQRKKRNGNRNNVMLIGAGSAGQMIIRDLAGSKHVYDRIVCIIDDDPNKLYTEIEGIPVTGNRDDILSCAKKYDIRKIYLAIPSATAQEKRDILNICKETGCELKYLPGMYQFILGEISVSAMKEVSIEDLLGREPIQTDMSEVFTFLNKKTVLVTGGGGSIGSELCRQIAAHDPKQLIIIDIYENNAYDIQLELQEKYPGLDLNVLICSIRDSRKMFQIFKEYHPQIVFHAAAHKHVPLMEDAPCEAIKNNALGTYKTAYAAMVHGCERFVLISTDKAVNPTNIMGASKRICEMIIQSFDHKIKEGKADEIPQLFTHQGDRKASDIDFSKVKTEFVAVRFGNVLGSNGSVIPVFQKQIAKGGPVTVTHPDIIRYFMTIPEAVSLVLTAGTYASGGDIFVLDMGSPIKIDTLARNLIKLAGYKPDVDIKIKYTGLRPGEKLYEEKLMDEEGLIKTPNELIFIGKPIPFDVDKFFKRLSEMMTLAYQNKNEEMKKLVSEIVPTYQIIQSEKPKTGKTVEKEKE